ncbi:MerR family DNA-binding transcriptional regulator [Brevibacillus reuszeri]|nr:MerR family DNA-binding transcriptional regulator [Brevibacillus reuszeri]KNB73448.1 transcriptional regulator [Brevibacillus reuszeri]MED1858766.1 MerR family DNA-binding transcriptional regulator [Brevibacillus reuszeri]
MRPIDISRRLGLSTSTLRNYERQGLVPPCQRSQAGYRIYTEEHLAYFECIEAMSLGFGMEITVQVVRGLQAKKMDSVLWLVTNSQANLYRDRQLAKSNIQMLESQEKETSSREESTEQEWMTIGEASAKTSIPASTIRHWEKIGLITLARDPQNGYRWINRSQLRKISLLRTLRSAVYSDTVVQLKQAIAELNHEDVAHARKIAQETTQYLDKMNQKQLRGMYYLYALCRSLHLIE